MTGQVIGAFHEVYNHLGYGFLESVYAKALEIEFQLRGVPYVREHPLDVLYKGHVAGSGRADFLVDVDIVVEIKATRQLGEPDRRQLLHYLKGTKMELGLLLHFGPKAEFHRMIFTR